MSLNYDLELKKVINNLDNTATLLLHTCCGPCSTYVVEYLKPHFDLTVLFYNPNIEPLKEYIKRKEELLKFLKNYPDIKIMDIDYNNEVFKKHTYNLKDYPENSIRCNICYSIRLDKTASLAKKYNYKYFTTTLSVSPFKNASIINKIGYNIGKKEGVLYLPADFKKNDGFKKSIELSKYYDLYRQDYCGCLSSKNK